METDIWLWARLYSRERNPSLSFFFQILFKIRDGFSFPSAELSGAFPELEHILKKTNEKEISQIRQGHFRAVQNGHVLLYPGHELYPRPFLTLEYPPMLISMKGSPIWLASEGLSVVGSREPSEASLQWMEQNISVFLKHTNSYIVSGGARGVDQKSHLLALRTGRPTVVFLPAGLGRIYPDSLARIIPQILATGGCLLSEYDDQEPMQKHFFSQRNRLIAALGKATLIIEARRGSGTVLTAQRSLEQSKPVWILPGHPMDVGMGGSLDLFQDGGTPVRDAVDLIQLFESEVQNFSCYDQDSIKYLVGSLKNDHYR